MNRTRHSVASVDDSPMTDHDREIRDLKDALFIAEQSYRDLAETTSDWLWEQDEKFRFTFLSDEVENHTGVKSQAFIGKTRWEMIGADAVRDPKWKNLAEIQEARKPFRDFQYAFTRPDGTASYLSISGKPFYGSDGAFLGYRGAGSDITARVEAERMASTLQQRLYDAINSLPHGFALFDADDRLVLSNRQFHLNPTGKLGEYGMSFEEIVRKAASNGIYHGEMGATEEWIEQRLKLHRSAPVEHEHQLSDRRWYRVAEFPTDEGGTVLLRTDITEHRAMEQSLRENEERMAIVLAGASDALWDWNVDTDEVIRAGSIREILDITDAPLIATGKDWLATVHPADRDGYRAIMADYLSGRSSEYRAEYRIRTVTDRTKWVSDCGKALRDDDGHAYRMAGSLRDITKRKIHELKIELSHRIAQDVRTASSYQDAISSTVQPVLDHAGAGYGEVWTCVSNGDVLTRSANTKSESDTLAALADSRRDTRELVGRSWIGEICGNTGLVLSTKIGAEYRPLVEGWEDLEAVGFRTSVGFAVPVLDDTIVFVLFFRKGELADEFAIEAIAELASEIASILRDKKTEEQMRLQGTALDSAANGIFITDAFGTIEWTNTAVTQMTGFLREELIGETARVFRSEYLEDGSGETLWSTILSGRSYRCEMTEPKRDGSTIDVSLIVTPIRDEKGSITHFITVSEDVTERKSAERALFEKTGVLETTFENMGAGISICDENLDVVGFNQEFLDLLEFPADLIAPGDNMEKLFRYNAERGEYGEGDVDEQVQQRIDLARKFEPHLLGRTRPDGTVIEIRGQPIPGGGFVTVYTDVTDRRKAEEELRAAKEAAESSRTTLETSIESISEGMALYDDAGRLIICNDTYRDYFSESADLLKPGMKFETLIRMRAEQGLAPDVGNNVDAWVKGRMAQFHKGSEPIFREFPDGRWCQVNEEKTANGGVAQIYTDVTELMEREQALKVSESRFRTLIDGSIQGILVHRYFKPLYVNPAYVEMFGYENADEILALSSALKLFAPEFRDKIGGFQKSRLKGEEAPREHELKVLRKDGTEFWVRSNPCVIDWEGEPAICQILFDVTDTRESRAQLIQASKLATLGEMATGVAHELNQPLNIIRMAAESAAELIEEEDELDPEFFKRKLERIAAQTERASSIIDHMRLFGRKSGSEPDAFDPIEAVKGAVGLLGEQLRTRGITLDTEIPKSCRRVIGNAIHVEQVVLNLMTNARDALHAMTAERPDGEGGGRIILSLVEDPDNACVEISVQDNGGGVPDSIIERIFEPFFTTKDAGQGTGLGLSISYTMIKEMGGQLTVANQNGGARFSVALLLTDAVENGLIDSEATANYAI